LGVLAKLRITLGAQIILINVEVVGALVEYNMLLGRNYMYAMNVVVSSTLISMQFLHEGKVVIINNLTYSDPNLS
jgi:hypothetical protein